MYSVVPAMEVSIVEGVQVPLMGVALDELVGKLGATSLMQYVVAIVGNVSVITSGAFTDIVTITGVPSQPFNTGVMV